MHLTCLTSLDISLTNLNKKYNWIPLLAGKSSVSYVSNLYKRSRNEKFEYLKILDKGNNEEGKSHLTYCRECN